MLYELVINEQLTGIVIPTGGAYKGIKFGRKTAKEGYVANGFYPIVDPKTPTPNLKKLDSKAKEFNEEEEQIDVVYSFRDLTEEEIAQKQQELFENAKIEAEGIVDMLIQGQFTIYNEKNGTLFKEVNALPRYILNRKSAHRKWATKVNDWIDDLWAKLRKIQSDVLKGKRELPTREEILMELPKF